MTPFRNDGHFQRRPFAVLVGHIVEIYYQVLGLLDKLIKITICHNIWLLL